MRVETERMYLYPLRDEEMRLVIEKESDPEMKQAYMEMLEGSLSNSDKRIWYAIWNMELKDESGIIVRANDKVKAANDAENMLEVV